MTETESDSSSKAGSPRRQYSPAERERLLCEFDRSGISGAAFARERGIGYSTLAAWRRQRKLREAESPPKAGSAFVELRLQPPPVGGGMAIRMGSLEVEVREAGQVEWAGRLLRAWREESC